MESCLSLSTYEINGKPLLKSIIDNEKRGLKLERQNIPFVFF